MAYYYDSQDCIMQTCPFCRCECSEVYVKDDIAIGCPDCVSIEDANEYFDRQVDHYDEYDRTEMEGME